MNTLFRAVACVASALLVACGSVHERLSPLDGAASVELYALDPRDVDLERVEPGAPMFHNYVVLGAATLKDPEATKNLARLISRGIAEHSDKVAGCFNPRHGLRVVRAGRTLDLVICYECLQIHVHDERVTNSSGYDGLLTSQSVEPDVTRIFESVGLKIAGK